MCVCMLLCACVSGCWQGECGRRSRLTGATGQLLLAIDTGVKNFQTHICTYSHSHTHCHTYLRIDALKMPNENIASNAAWQCKCICKINRCIYLGEGFIIVSMPVCMCMSECASSCCDAKNNASVLFLQFCLHARVYACVCVRFGGTYPKLTLLCICFTR